MRPVGIFLIGAEGDREAALQALLLDPHVNDISLA